VFTPSSGLARAGAGRARGSVEPLATDVARRHAREHARVAEYFEAMVAELAGAARKSDPETLASRIMAVVAESDGKLRILRQRFALRVRLVPVSSRWCQGALYYRQGARASPTARTRGSAPPSSARATSRPACLRRVRWFHATPGFVTSACTCSVSDALLTRGAALLALLAA